MVPLRKCWYFNKGKEFIYKNVVFFIGIGHNKIRV